MSCDLLVIEPSDSSSMLGPVFALEVFLARPHRWRASFLDTAFGGIRVLPNSRLGTVLKAWAKERGLRFSVIRADEPLNEQVSAVLTFGNDASATIQEVLVALGVETVTIDLDSGVILDGDPKIANISPLVPSRPSGPEIRRAEDGGLN